MYGWVNKGVGDLVVRLDGPELWTTIAAKAGVELPVFVAKEPYDDALSYRLVEAASDVTGPHNPVSNVWGSWPPPDPGTLSSSTATRARGGSPTPTANSGFGAIPYRMPSYLLFSVVSRLSRTPMAHRG